MTDTFDITTSTTKTYREGWGVDITPIWSGEEEQDETVADIDVQVVRLAGDSWEMIGNVPCVKIGENAYAPLENFKELEDLSDGDTHDLRSRWFATRGEAEEHARYTEDRFRHPSPWESFVQV